MAGPVGSGCLTVAAGAAFETRKSHNSYSVVKLDLSRGVSIVEVFRYNPVSDSFTLSASDSGEYPIEVDAITTCDVAELATAMRGHHPALASLAFYLAALLLEKKAEFLISTSNAHTFGSFELLKEASDGELKQTTIEFMKFKNILRVLYGRVRLPEILDQNSMLIVPYGNILAAASDGALTLRERLQHLENDSQSLATTEPRRSFSHILSLLEELAADGEWLQLRGQAERYLDVVDLVTAHQVKRMLAFGLAQSEESADMGKAITLYRSLIESDYVTENDMRSLAVLLYGAGCTEGAMEMVLEGIRKYPAKVALFTEVGHEIIGATGDIAFRTQLENATRGQA